MRKAAFGVAIGLGVLALSFAVLGLVLNNQANFSKSYVHDQLAEKQITFTPVENLLPNQKTVPCLVENAGQAAGERQAGRVLREVPDRPRPRARSTTARPTSRTTTRRTCCG